MTAIANKENTLIINTGLTDSASLNVLKSTLGQLSDGMWETAEKLSDTGRLQKLK